MPGPRLSGIAADRRERGPPASRARARHSAGTPRSRRARCRPRPAPARRSGAHCPASPFRRGRGRDCRDGRRDAARRGRRCRARAVRPAITRAGAPNRSTYSCASLRVAELVLDRGIGRDQRPHVDVLAHQRAGQGAGDVGKAPRLDEREDLRGDRQNLQAAHRLSFSIIGPVMSVTPLSVRRKRLASSTGSSPTTRPSGIVTSLSITTLLSRTCRPICA